MHDDHIYYVKNAHHSVTLWYEAWFDLFLFLIQIAIIVFVLLFIRLPREILKRWPL